MLEAMLHPLVQDLVPFVQLGITNTPRTHAVPAVPENSPVLVPPAVRHVHLVIRAIKLLEGAPVAPQVSMLPILPRAKTV